MSLTVYSSALQLPTGKTSERPRNPTGGMLFFNTDKDDIEKYDPSVGRWVDLTLKLYRYWRYVEGSAVIGHHPRVSRIVMENEHGGMTNIAVYAGDNCSDSGSYTPGTVTYDFGAANPQRIIRVWIYSVYNGGLRSSNYTVQYSNDNSNWFTYFSGLATNYNFTTPSTSGSAVCGMTLNTGGLPA